MQKHVAPGEGVTHEYMVTEPNSNDGTTDLDNRVSGSSNGTSGNLYGYKAGESGADMQQHQQKEKQQIEILLQFFEASRNYCVCLVDIVNSTGVTMKMPHQQISRYYGIFLNMMAEIASGFGAAIVKNIGDSLLYYFPKTDSGSHESFADVLRCCVAMIEARPVLNEALEREGLPEISYRISCEYGSVAVAKVSTSSVHDIFGPSVNLCSKINAIAPTNGIVIGEGMYDKVKSFEGYTFTEATYRQVSSAKDAAGPDHGNSSYYHTYIVSVAK